MSSVYTVRNIMKCTHVCAAQKAYKLFTKLKIKPDFTSLADEIAEPHPDMNIKVAAFTVSEKSSNTLILSYIRRSRPFFWVKHFEFRYVFGFIET